MHNPQTQALLAESAQNDIARLLLTNPVALVIYVAILWHWILKPLFGSEDGGNHDKTGNYGATSKPYHRKAGQYRTDSKPSDDQLESHGTGPKMIAGRATCEANHKRFIEQIIKNETIWYLENDAGVASSVSNGDNERAVLMFWSDEAYAQRVKKQSFDDYEVAAVNLFDFLCQRLPDMISDSAIAGTNWSAHLIGLETDALKLREQIESQMPQSHLSKFEDRA